MATTELNPDSVDAAMALLNAAAADLKSRLSAKGYGKADVSVSGYGFSVYPKGVGAPYTPGLDTSCLPWAKALAHIDALPDVPAWSPELIEASLGVGEAA